MLCVKLDTAKWGLFTAEFISCSCLGDTAVWWCIIVLLCCLSSLKFSPLLYLYFIAVLAVNVKFALSLLCVCMSILSGKAIPEMTYTVSGGTLKPTRWVSLLFVFHFTFHHFIFFLPVVS